MKPNHNLFRWLQHDIRLESRYRPVRLRLAPFDPLKPLEDANDSIPYLSQSKLLAHANSRPSVEGNVRPRLRLPRQPAIRIVVQRAGASRIERSPALHGQSGVSDESVFQDSYRQVSAWATTPR